MARKAQRYRYRLVNGNCKNWQYGVWLVIIRCCKCHLGLFLFLYSVLVSISICSISSSRALICIRFFALHHKLGIGGGGGLKTNISVRVTFREIASRDRQRYYESHPVLSSDSRKNYCTQVQVQGVLLERNQSRTSYASN